MNMGFPENDVVYALIQCDDVYKAANWLLEEGKAPLGWSQPEPEKETRTLYVNDLLMNKVIQLQVVPNVTVWGIKKKICKFYSCQMIFI